LKNLWHFESGIWKVWKNGREHGVMAAMTMAATELPDDVDALKAMIIAMAEQRALLEARTSHLEVMNKTSDERIATLTAIVRMLERSRYGTRSERLRGATLSDERHAFVFDEIKTGLAAIEAELEGTARDKPKRAPRSRKGFAADLERVEIVIEPEFRRAVMDWRGFRSARTCPSVWT
jgi:transposase